METWYGQNDKPKYRCKQFSNRKLWQMMKHGEWVFILTKPKDIDQTEELPPF